MPFLLAAGLFAAGNAVGGAPAFGTAFTYQGRLLDAGSEANGFFDVYFELYDLEIGGAPVADTTVTGIPVTNGLFVTKVDFGPGAFDGVNYWLQIGVRTNGGGAFATLEPRTELTPHPYTLRSRLAEEALNATGLANNIVTSSHILDSSVGAADLADNSVTSAKIADGSVTTTDLADNGVTSAKLADSINLGIGNAGLLNILDSDSEVAISLNGVANTLTTHGDDGLERTRLWGPSWGQLLLRDNTGNDTTVALSANSNSGGELELRNANASPTVNIDGGTSILQVTNKLQIVSTVVAGAMFAELGKNGSGGGVFRSNDELGNQTVIMGSPAGGGGGFMNMHMNGSIWPGITLDGDDGNSGAIFLRTSNNVTKIELDAYAVNGAGEISMFDTDGHETVEIIAAEGTANGAQITLRTAAGASRLVLDGDYSTTLGGSISVFDADGTETVLIRGAEGSSQGAEIALRRADGTATITLDADFNNDGRVITDELQITGGSDLSEQFDVTASNRVIQPGMVVCIDPAQPGRLQVSESAYDRTVAGVLSGAGGVKPGMLMGQRGTVADGHHPVALTGRVYCMADASRQPIRPGDLLTTSDRPGHAMRVTDFIRAQGAILGKAMTPLENDTGLVLVLVTLQ